MAKLSVFLKICVVTLLFVSCNQIEELDNVYNSNNINVTEISPLKAAYIVDDGILNFRSIEDYYKLTDSLSQLSDFEYKNWTKQIGFDSYRNVIDDIMKSDKSDEELLRFYADYIHKDSIGCIVPNIDFRIYQNVLNKDGLFYINNVVYSFSEDKLASKVLKKMSSPLKYDISPKQVTVVEYPDIEYANNWLGKKVMTHFKLYKNTVTDTPLKGNQLIFEVYVRPREFNSVLGWKDCKDDCMSEEVTFHMEDLGLMRYKDETGNYITKEDHWSDLHTFSSSSPTRLFVASYVVIHQNIGTGPIVPLPVLKDPVCVHYRARIGSLGKNGAAYNTYHPLPGMDKEDCGHRLVTEYQHIEY